jgi:nucleoside-diphosphate-sugar epimerase
MNTSTQQAVFVTGGTGLLGTHLLVKLAKEGQSIRALKRENSNLQIVKQVFDFYEVGGLFNTIEWVIGDITDTTSLPEAIGEATKVYHTAALVSFDPRDREKLYKINIEGTANVVNACLEKGIDKLCYVSSTAAVGKTKDNAIVVESNDWIEEDVTSNYSISKHYAENEVWRGIAEGLNAVMVNPCVVIGPGDWERSSGTLFKTIKNGLKFYTPGANAFVDARDVVDAMFLLMESEINEERFLLIGENQTYKEMFTKAAVAMGVKPPSILVKGLLVGLSWRLEKLRSLVTGNPPVVTSESAQSAVNTIRFSHQKFVDATGFKFRTVEEAATNAAAYYTGIGK